MATDQEKQYLSILSIFHYIVGAMTGLFACFPLIHLSIGLSMLTGGFGPMPADEEFPARLFGLMFVLIPAAIIFSGWLLAGCMLAAGYFLSKYRHHTYCLVIAGVECIFMPFGTVLGVFTIILLVRPGIKALFDGSLPQSLSG